MVVGGEGLHTLLNACACQPGSRNLKQGHWYASLDWLHKLQLCQVDDQPWLADH
jgi:hypothetical protein